MIISNQQNRFLRAIISEFRDQLVKGVEGGEKATPDAVKTMLTYKFFGDVVSFTKITSKEATNFAEFVFAEGGERGFKFSKNEEEWNRLLEKADIYH